VGRIYLESDERFWSLRGESGDASTDLDIGRVRDETAAQEAKSGVLGAYLTGKRATLFAGLSETERIQKALSDAETAHPGLKSHFKHGLTKFWAEDPYARGAYAWYRPGQLTRYANVIGAAEGRIHFCGDHTSYRPGFMHGALASSQRVVEE